MSERQRIGVPWKCRPSRNVKWLLDVFLALDSVKKTMVYSRYSNIICRKHLEGNQ